MNSVNQPAYKKCPKCQTVAAIGAPVCAACGHQFRTQFTQPTNQTAPQPPQPTQAMPAGMGPGTPAYQAPSATNPGIVGLTPTNHSPVIALLLALFLPYLPGIATVYNRQYAKAAALLAVIFGTTCLWWQALLAFGTAEARATSVASSPDAKGADGGLLAFLFVLSFVPPILYLAYIVDAFLIAKKLSEGRPVRQWECF